MSKVEDIFTIKHCIEDMKEICKHYSKCLECPALQTGICDCNSPLEWDTGIMFSEKR